LLKKGITQLGLGDTLEEEKAGKRRRRQRDSKDYLEKKTVWFSALTGN